MSLNELMESAMEAVRNGDSGIAGFRKYLRKLWEIPECDTMDAYFAAKERLKALFGAEDQ